MTARSVRALAALGVAALTGCGRQAPPGVVRMSFFVTSTASGDGGNIGGLAAADAHCASLARGVGSPKKEWRAYLSAEENGRVVNARDRIGHGPWFNADGIEIAANVADLHGAENYLGAETSLDEHGEPVGFFHDMLTGSNADGTLARGDVTCGNWTRTQGHAIVGHADKRGSCCGTSAGSWNAAHETRGCTLAALQALGGSGRFYCFAVD